MYPGHAQDTSCGRRVRHDQAKSPLDLPTTLQRLSEFIDATSLGGLCPTAFADRISTLAAGATLNNVLRAILLHALPPQPRAVLRPSTASFHALTAEADKFFDVNGGLIESTPFSVTISGSGAGDAESIAAFRQRPPKATPPKSTADECFYHKKFGTDAKKCTAPCKWSAAPCKWSAAPPLNKGYRSGNNGAGRKW